ncbi:hypothetical protein NQT65_19265 [Pseudoalteromonas agarivorans]|uniref:hypothetical protein n=1 Tax=Pseudoalteromonas agarivorans TaxID=176102 RepID=UPI0021197EEA|nr:hypothetical protein [Pseudoalteromonas agarivorans]MCQ8822335.1 hypothetical protein [Pseudoalteromonas agarivorans]
MKKINKEEAVKSLPPIDDAALRDAVELALWLYLDKKWTLKGAVSKASEKRYFKPKSKIEKLVRYAIPDEEILSRKKIPQNSQDKNVVHRNAMMKSMEIDAAYHMKNI